MNDERDRHLRHAHRYARRAERWSTVAMWGSGCALALYAVAGLLVVAVVVLVVVAFMGS
jgi:hypothetical protein